MGYYNVCCVEIDGNRSMDAVFSSVCQAIEECRWVAGPGTCGAPWAGRCGVGSAGACRSPVSQYLIQPPPTPPSFECPPPPRNKLSDPLEEFCNSNPGDLECKVFDVRGRLGRLGGLVGWLGGLVGWLVGAHAASSSINTNTNTNPTQPNS
jgi:hypothetical protein